MKTLTLKNGYEGNSTLIQNDFIDHYMAKANGEYVKVYLFLLRHLNTPNMELSISGIADALETTDKDILRALTYWAKEKLIRLERDETDKIIGLEVGCAASAFSKESEDSSLPESVLTTLTPRETPAPAPAKSRRELKQLLFVAEQYLGKTLTKTDMDAITYFYDTLNFSADLIEYLIEYCVENNHKSMYYIKKVAFNWADQHITTVEQARESSNLYNKNYYSVLNAFGIKDRAAASIETAFIKKWLEEYGFSLDIIIEACNRTMAAIHKPSFEYADSILKNWRNENVHYLSDIEALDASHQKEKAARKPSAPKPIVKTNKFNNFKGRDYDLDSLEYELLNSK